MFGNLALDVFCLEGWVKVREHQSLGPRDSRDGTALSWRQVRGQRQRIWQRTLAQQDVTSFSPHGQRRVESSVARHHHAPSASADGICHTLGGVRNLQGREEGVSTQLNGIPACQLGDLDGWRSIEKLAAECRFHGFEQRGEAWWTNELDGL